MVSKAVAAVSLEDPPTGGEGGALQEQLTQEVFERAGAQATMEFASLQAQLEGLKPSWLENLRAEHDYAAESQLEAMLALKMQEVGSAIPLRRTAERKFRHELDLVDQSLEDVADIVRALQAKEAEDPSGQVDLRQATALAHTLESTRLPDLEAVYREANEAWFKPGKDPIVALFVGVTRKIARWAAELEVEETRRAPDERPDGQMEREPAQPMAMCDSQTLIRFDAKKLVSKFHGDLREPGVLQKFSNWKSSWVNLVQEMESFRGFNKVILFQKLKDCLDGPALDLVSKYSCESVNSYEAAMKDLLFKFEDPIELAGSYLSEALAPRDSLPEQCEAMRHAFNALHNMEDVFEREGVKMYDFAIIQNLSSALSVEGQGKWKSYKAKKRHEYRLRGEEALRAGETIPDWKEGMVQNYEQFNAWLQIQAILVEPPSSALGQSQLEPVATAANFAISGQPQQDKSGTARCPIDDGNHRIHRCPKGLAMSQTEWFQACRKVGICARCVKPFASGHRCQSPTLASQADQAVHGRFRRKDQLAWLTNDDS